MSEYKLKLFSDFNITPLEKSMIPNFSKRYSIIEYVENNFKILNEYPNDFDSNHLHGVVLSQKKNYKSSIKSSY